MTTYVTDVYNWLGGTATGVYSGVGAVFQGAEKPAASAVTKAATIFVIQGASNMSMFIRIAGISGVLAVGLGAYGAHGLRGSDAEERLKLTFETGNRYHFLHTIALLATPLTKRPLLVGTMMSMGMLLFCGSCYIHALTDNQEIRQVTPYGGILLMAAWAAMVL